MFPADTHAPHPAAPVRSRRIHPCAGMQAGVAETGRDFSLVEVALPPGGAVADHAHVSEEETIYVVEGTLDVRVGEVRRMLAPGECVLAPCGAVHGFANAGLTPARVLLIASPAIAGAHAFVGLAAGFATTQGHGPGGA